jgi:hypothetical protein
MSKDKEPVAWTRTSPLAKRLNDASADNLAESAIASCRKDGAWGICSSGDRIVVVLKPNRGLIEVYDCRLLREARCRR